MIHGLTSKASVSACPQDFANPSHAATARVLCDVIRHKMAGIHNLDDSTESHMAPSNSIGHVCSGPHTSDMIH